MIKYGLVGYSLNAFGYKTELEKHPKLNERTKFIVAYDPAPDAKKNLGRIKDIKIADSFEDLLDTSELKAILICSPPQFHAKQAVSALEAGLHVYSEIPMAINDKEIEKIINAEENSGKIYQLGENYCFYPEVLYAGYLASSGLIGPTVYTESEYLHDITYRWRKGNQGGTETPRIDSWYQLFDPLMYAHSIGPAQVALGGIKNPMPFVEVTSFANNIGGYEDKPVCEPAKAFHVGLFRTQTNAIAKCANAYIFAREPNRISIQVIGRTGAYECYEIGKPGRLFKAKDHIITRSKHRKGISEIINKEKISEIIEPIEGLYYGAQVRIIDNWLTSIENNRKALLSANVGANFCYAGIAASKSARSNGKPVKIKTYSN
ncbi:MAG: Gfo/Idh/MocA family oxidoreductase [Candidatus Lokiarchaeota archaeon]